MSFPYHDPFWCEAADFVEKRARRSDSILAPDIFWWRFPKIYRYVNTTLRPEHKYDWIILHKGLIHELPGQFVIQSFESLEPTFANEVFVVLARTNHGEGLDPDDPHLLALTERLPQLATEKGLLASSLDEEVSPEPGAIFKLSGLDDREFEEAMDAFWKNGGYIYSTLRDKTYYQEIDRSIAECIGDGAGQVILDLACGIGRCGEILSPESLVVGIDVSGFAIELAKDRHKGLPNFSFQRMDAHSLSFEDESFDIVLFIDAIEHVKSAERVFSEIARVLKPGGRVLLTAANRDSVNQVLMRRLGYPEFVTNYQHIREFSYAETRDLLDDQGLELEQSRGIFLYPYWGVPGADEAVRKVADDDPEFVDLMRLLGERVGAEYAYCSVVFARKAPGR